MARRLLGGRMTRNRNSSNKLLKQYTHHVLYLHHLNVVTVDKTGKTALSTSIQYILQVLFHITKYICYFLDNGN
jgi:hypothetical protein